MLDLGFSELSMEPVVCAPEILRADRRRPRHRHGAVRKLAELMLEAAAPGKPFTFYHYMIDLKGGPCIYKRISGCGSHRVHGRHAVGRLLPLPPVRRRRKIPPRRCLDRRDEHRNSGRFRLLQRVRSPRVPRLLGKTVPAPAAAPQTPTTPPAPSAAFTKRAASSLKNAWNAPSCSKPLRHWITTHDNRANLRICAPLPI